MALSEEQQELYVHAADVWRLLPGSPGSPKSWTRVQTALPCYFQSGMGRRKPEEFGLSELDGREALDTLHCEGGAFLQPEDYVQQVAGPLAGRWFRVRVHPLGASLWANKAAVLLQRGVQKAQGIP